MSNDPNVPPHQPEPHQGQFPPFHGQGQPFPPQYTQPQPGQYPQQGQFQQPHPGQPYPPQYKGQYPPSGPPPKQERQPRDPNQPKSRFGVWFWVVAGLLAMSVLGNAAAANGETILIILGIAAALTGLFSLIFKRPGRSLLFMRTDYRYSRFRSISPFSTIQGSLKA